MINVRMREFNRYDKYVARLSKALETISKIEQEMEADVQQLSIVDKELSDYMHVIEDEDEIKYPVRLINKIRIARRRRREIKITTAVLHKFRQLALKMNNEANRKMLIADLYKEISRQKQEYNYRVIEKDEVK